MSGCGGENSMPPMPRRPGDPGPGNDWPPEAGRAAQQPAYRGVAIVGDPARPEQPPQILPDRGRQFGLQLTLEPAATGERRQYCRLNRGLSELTAGESQLGRLRQMKTELSVCRAQASGTRHHENARTEQLIEHGRVIVSYQIGRAHV